MSVCFQWKKGNYSSRSWFQVYLMLCWSTLVILCLQQEPPSIACHALSVGKALVMFPPLASSSAPPSSPFTSLLVTLTPYSCLYMLRPTIINLISPSSLHFLLPLSPSFFFCPLWHLSSMYSCLTLGLLVDPNRNETTVLWSNRYSYMLVTLLQEKSLSMLVNFVSDGPTVQIL